MAKINKKLERLHDLKESVLQSILTACENEYFDQERFNSECEIIHNGVSVGEVKYKVSVETLIPSFGGDYDYPPDAGEYDFILESCKVDMFFDEDGNSLPKRTNAINHLLFLEEGEILKS
jgi:hypothetical protein